MSKTVGVYLKQKISNMATWITEEVGKENLSVDICTFANNMRQVEVTLLGEVLSEPKLSACVTHRDWRELQAALAKQTEIVPSDVLSALHVIMCAVYAKREMHDKFWRYLELFRDVVQKSDE